MEIEIALDQAIALIRADRKCSRSQAIAYIAGYLFANVSMDNPEIIAKMTKINK